MEQTERSLSTDTGIRPIFARDFSIRLGQYPVLLFRENYEMILIVFTKF